MAAYLGLWLVGLLKATWLLEVQAITGSNSAQMALQQGQAGFIRLRACSFFRDLRRFPLISMPRYVPRYVLRYLHAFSGAVVCGPFIADALNVLH